MLPYIATDQRIHVQRTDGFIQKKRVRRDRSKPLPEKLRPGAEYFFWDGAHVQEGAQP